MKIIVSILFSCFLKRYNIIALSRSEKEYEIIVRYNKFL